MTNRALLQTAIQIFGLYFVILVVINVRDIIFSLSGVLFTDDLDSIWFVLGYESFQIIFNSTVALILLFKTELVMTKFRIEETLAVNINPDKTDLIELAIIVISTLAPLNAFPEIMYKLIHYAYFNDHEPHEQRFFWTNKNKADLFFSIFKFVTGLFIFVNARNFARRLTKIGEVEDKRSL